MKRPLAWTAGILAVAALIGCIAWLLHADGRVTYHRASATVASYGPAPADSRALVLSTAMLSSGDKDVTARVVTESSSRVVVAMSYQRCECRGCARTAQGLVISATVRLRAPLGERAVIDRFTGRPVRYTTTP